MVKIWLSFYHIRKLAEEFNGQFECFGENIGNYNISLPIEKELSNNKQVTCKITFIHTLRCMTSS